MIALEGSNEGLCRAVALRAFDRRDARDEADVSRETSGALRRDAVIIQPTASLDYGGRTSAILRAMLIRNEQEGDHASIAVVTARAFAGAKHSDQTEPTIIERLRATEALALSLVAVEHGRVIGHIAFSPVTINGVHDGWFGLGPVSVEPGQQANGVGSALIRKGLDQLHSQGAAGCVVLGDPAYYCRFGFMPDDRLRYGEAPSEYFMRLILTDDEPRTGRVDYAPAFTG